MLSVPVAVSPKKSFIKGTSTRRSRKYSTRLLPLARASRWASSWVRPTSALLLAGLQCLPAPPAQHGGDHDVDHDQDRVSDVVAGRSVLLGVDEGLREPCIGEHVPDGDEQQDDGVLAFELHDASLQTGQSPSPWSPAAGWSATVDHEALAPL